MVSLDSDLTFSFNEENVHFQIETKAGANWQWASHYDPYLIINGQKVLFREAREILHAPYRSGLGKGIYSTFRGFTVSETSGEASSETATETPSDLAFATLIWQEDATGDVYFEWIPLAEEPRITAVYWPGPMEFTKASPEWTTLLPIQQGLLIPNNWPVELGQIAFDGRFGTAGAYLPMFAQIKDGQAYLAICETPWNAGYEAVHPAGGPFTEVSVRLEPSLGRMSERRVLKYHFMEGADHVALAKAYRRHAEEEGKILTLAQKALQNPSIHQLAGSFFVHQGIKTFVQEDSDMYDAVNPEANNHLHTFAEREAEVQHWQDLGIKKLYLHLDGWAEPGYDNNHPDYFPACEAAGGWDGLRSLADRMHEAGYLFGIHDQYRDFYEKAESFDLRFACELPDGTHPQHQHWAGGPQSYLCTTQAPAYVKRNFSRLQAEGISLDAAYLDVFTCNEGDECNHPDHRMTRRESYDERQKCFHYLTSQGIMPSSEEVNDWAIRSQVFCHYAPYDFMMREPGSPKYGIPVPLFNLVYHDCVIQPWMMDRVSQTEDYMLYALLNGGAPYFIRDAAYPNIDGSFADTVAVSEDEQVSRCQVVADLHEKVALLELYSHRFVGGDPWVQESVFADGTRVTVDFHSQTYVIDRDIDRVIDRAVDNVIDRAVDRRAVDKSGIDREESK